MSGTMIITGTSKGIGRDLVDYYMGKGWTVAGCARSEMETPPEGYHHYTLDVSDEAAVQAMVMDVDRNLGPIKVLLNNAGIASMNHALLTPLKTVDRIFRTNVYGSFLFAREAAKTMMRGRYGRIVNFATVATPLKLEGELAYAASKAAVCSMTEILAKEVGGFGVTVNAVGPTPVQTDLIKGVSDAKIGALIDSQSVKRMGEYRDIQNVIDFFIDEQSDFVTGQTLYLGGIS